MIYTPHQINREHSKNIKVPRTKKYIRYVPKKAFPDYLSEEKISPNILGNIDISKPEKTNDEKVEITTNGRVYQYPITKKKSKLKGYISVGDSNFVGIYEDDKFFLIPIMMFTYLWCVIIFMLLTHYRTPVIAERNPSLIENPGDSIPVAEGYDYSGNPQTGSPVLPEEEFISIPGYTTLYINKNNKILQLINPAENTVYFVYTIQYKGETIYQSAKIAPGQAIDADISNKVSIGESEATI